MNTKTIKINPKLTSAEFGCNPPIFEAHVKNKDLPVIDYHKGYFKVDVAGEHYSVHQSYACQISIKNLVPAVAIHPGEILSDEMEARELTCHQLALNSDLPYRDLINIIAQKGEITEQVARGLSSALGIHADYWMNLQSNYESDVARIQEEYKP